MNYTQNWLIFYLIKLPSCFSCGPNSFTPFYNPGTIYRFTLLRIKVHKYGKILDHWSLAPILNTFLFRITHDVLGHIRPLA